MLRECDAVVVVVVVVECSLLSCFVYCLDCGWLEIYTVSNLVVAVVY